MKKILLVLTLGLMLFTGCQKENIEPNNVNGIENTNDKHQ